jgi:biopolymer transport protein ExbD/biopolymer transport protein TolR
MSIAVRDESKKVSSNINVTPMVDVMLVLLIIFMVITPMLQNKVAVDMAKVDNPTAMPDADKEDAIVVAITRDGTVYLGQNKVSANELGALVRTKLENTPGKTIYVRADARAQYRAVEDAIDAVRTASIASSNARYCARASARTNIVLPGVFSSLVRTRVPSSLAATLFCPR